MRAHGTYTPRGRAVVAATVAEHKADEVTRVFRAGRDLPRLSLRANFSWTLVGNVVYAGCQWGMLSVLAKLGTPEMVGQFSLGLAIGAPMFTLANLQLRAVQATDARQEYDFSDYLALRLITSALALLVVAGIAVIADYRPEMVLVVFALGLYKAMQSLSDVFHGLMQKRERMDYIARALIFKGPLALVAFAASVYLTRSVAWAGVGLVAVYLLVLFYERRAAGRVLAGAEPEGLRPRWQPARLAALTRLALPLGVVMMLISLNTNIPRYVIERTLGEAELGFFSAMAYVQVAGTTIVGALGQAASPPLARYHAQGQRGAYVALLGRLLAIAALVGLAGVVVAMTLGRPLLALLYGAEYAARPEVFTWLMVAAAVSYVASILGYGMTAARRFRPQLPLFALTAGVMTAASAVLVPRYELIGAAWALLLVALGQVVGSVYVIANALRALPSTKGVA